MQRLKGVGRHRRGARPAAPCCSRTAAQAVRFPVAPEQVEREVERLQRVARPRRASSSKASRRASADGPASDLAPLFDAQLLMLDDPMLLGRAVALIREERVNAEWAVQRAFDEIEQRVRRDRGPVPARAQGRRRRRRRAAADEPAPGQRRRARRCCAHIDGPFVLVADELSPSMAAQIDWTRVRGFAMDAGSRTYHTAILARSLQIPAIVGLHDATSRVMAGDMRRHRRRDGRADRRSDAGRSLREALARQHAARHRPGPRRPCSKGRPPRGTACASASRRTSTCPTTRRSRAATAPKASGCSDPSSCSARTAADGPSEEQQYRGVPAAGRRAWRRGRSPSARFDLDEHRRRPARRGRRADRRASERRSPLGLRGICA